MISTATTGTKQPRQADPDPPDYCDAPETPMLNLAAARRVLRSHQSHVSAAARPCPSWLGATAYLMADYGDDE